MNRKIAPKYHKIEQINFIEPQIEKLSNGLQVASFQTGSQEVLKITLIFEAGTRFGKSPLAATLTNLMLREGTEKYDSEHIAETLDFYGTHLSLSVTKDVANITLYSLSKHLDYALDMLTEIVLHPTFPQDKLDILLQTQKQKHQHNLEKVKFIANQKFTKELFGSEHPYGKTINIEDYNQISRKSLVNFYKQHYTLSNCKMIVAGKYDNTVLTKIKEHFLIEKQAKGNEKLILNETIVHPQQTFVIERDDAMQSALRVGKGLFNLHHPDYQDLKIVNTILGGYFGSRLMKNIREDKGYTYGIGSAIVSHQYSGFFTIVSEVNSSVSNQAIEEVRKEIKLMRTELVNAEELERVRSYMLGQMLRMLDGPFEMSEVFSSVWMKEQNWDYYRQYIKHIQNIKPERIMNLTEQYLHEDSMLYVIAGKYKDKN